MIRVSFLILALGAAALAKDVDFSREVLPILSDACFACHGPDENKREAKLRLDTMEGLYRTLDDITVVKPGSVKESELITRIHQCYAYGLALVQVLLTQTDASPSVEQQADLARVWLKKDQGSVMERLLEPTRAGFAKAFAAACRNFFAGAFRDAASGVAQSISSRVEAAR